MTMCVADQLAGTGVASSAVGVTHLGMTVIKGKNTLPLNGGERLTDFFGGDKSASHYLYDRVTC
jgi:hypothetical protein